MKRIESPGLQEVISPLLICRSQNEGQGSHRLFHCHQEIHLKFVHQIERSTCSPTCLSFSSLLVSFPSLTDVPFLVIPHPLSPLSTPSSHTFFPPPTASSPSHRGSEERHSGASPSSALQTQQAQSPLQSQRDDVREGKLKTIIGNPAMSELLTEMPSAQLLTF